MDLRARLFSFLLRLFHGHLLCAAVLDLLAWLPTCQIFDGLGMGSLCNQCISTHVAGSVQCHFHKDG